MPGEEKRGITVKIDAELHAEVKQYLEEHGMTMAELVTLALQDELHPKMQQKEGGEMGNMRTLAFQVPEELFQKIKDYLHRNHLSQKEFMIGLIETELERDLAERETERETENEVQTDTPESEQEADQEGAGQEETEQGADQESVEQEEMEQEEAGNGYEVEDEAADPDETEDESEDESEDEEQGFTLGM